LSVKNQVLINKPQYVRKDIYSDDFVGNIFISIDLKSANFTTIKNFDGDIFNEKNSWHDYMAHEGVDEFVASSKHFREVFFGEINMCKKTHKMYIYSLDKALTYIKQKYNYKDEDIVCISGDEIVLKYNEHYPAELLNTYPNEYNIEVFALNKPLDTHPYYIKHMIENSKGQGNVIKCVPKNYICQFIKYIEKKDITSNDLKFTSEKMIATYEKSIIKELNAKYSSITINEKKVVYYAKIGLVGFTVGLTIGAAANLLQRYMK
jgi:hypothetical protein